MKPNVNAIRFFAEHAGYIVGERFLGAVRLVRAEAYAQSMEWEFDWKWDDDPDLSWCERCETRRKLERHEIDPQSIRLADRLSLMNHDHEVLGCVLKDSSGDQLASLWSIADPTPEYRRVVEAELALQAMPADVGFFRDDPTLNPHAERK